MPLIYNFKISYTSLSMWGGDYGQSKKQNTRKIKDLIQRPERTELYRDLEAEYRMWRSKGTAGIVSSEYLLVFIIKDNALK